MMYFRFKDEVGDKLRWISLVSSGDPIIHMWITVCTVDLGKTK